MKKNVICNKCGRKLENDGTVITEDYLDVKKAWGYFSNKDGVTQSFCICEKCVDEMLQGFKLPPNEEATIELL